MYRRFDSDPALFKSQSLSRSPLSEARLALRLVSEQPPQTRRALACSDRSSDVPMCVPE